MRRWEPTPPAFRINDEPAFRRGRGTHAMNVDEGDATEATGTCHARLRLSALSREPLDAVPVDVRAIRGHFAFPALGRVVTNNAASTQPPRELVALYQSLAPGYENVHRGQSSASQQMTALFEESYDTIAAHHYPPKAPWHRPWPRQPGQPPAQAHIPARSS
jgi:hypothetical protein